MKTRKIAFSSFRTHIASILCVFLIFAADTVSARHPRKPTHAVLDPLKIPKFVNELPILDVLKPDAGQGTTKYTVIAKQFYQQILPHGFPPTKVFGFGGAVLDDDHHDNHPPHAHHDKLKFSSPGPTIEAIRNVPILVQYKNELKGKHMFAVDPTIMFANPNSMEEPMPPFKNSHLVTKMPKALSL